MTHGNDTENTDLLVFGLEFDALHRGTVVELRAPHLYGVPFHELERVGPGWGAHSTGVRHWHSSATGSRDRSTIFNHLDDVPVQPLDRYKAHCRLRFHPFVFVCLGHVHP